MAKAQGTGGCSGLWKGRQNTSLQQGAVCDHQPNSRSLNVYKTKVNITSTSHDIANLSMYTHHTEGQKTGCVAEDQLYRG